MEAPKSISEYVRVLKLARQPDTKEFLQVAGVAGIGVGLIGTLGFIMYVVLQFLP